MIFLGKLLLTGVVISTIIPSTLLLSSCFSNSKEDFNLGIPKALEDEYGLKIKDRLITNKNETQRNTVLITSRGTVNDLSFNQSAWGALELYKKQAEMTGNSITYKETKSTHELNTRYDEALKENYLTWVLTGFDQAEIFQIWLNKGNNRKDFIASKAVVVGVDWDGSSFVPEGQFFGLGFKTNEAAWIVGYAASDYLTSQGLPPHLSSFGGGSFSGVTDFNNGFLQGMLDWNIDNPTKKVKFYSGNKESSKINLDTGFNDTSINQQVVNNIVGSSENSPQIILPVAGPLTGATLNNIREKWTSQMIVGVDSDQALAFPKSKNLFFSSIEKRVSVAVYKSLVLLTGIHLESAGGNTNFSGSFIKGKTNGFVKYGIEENFVGYSPSTLEGNKAVIANNFLEQATIKYKMRTINWVILNDAIDGFNQKALDNLIQKINAN